MKCFLLCVMGCLAACKQAPPGPTRADVMRGIVDAIVTPDLRALVTSQSLLTVRLSELERLPSDTTLQTARQAWRAAVIAWERTRVLRLGPMVDTRAQLRSTFWPIRAATLARLETQPVPDDAAVERLGVDVRGMFALELLLWGPPLGDPQRALASALARNVEHYARTAAQALADGEVFKQALVREEQSSINQMAHLLVGSVETIATDRLAPARIGTGHKSVRLAEMRGYPSDMSGALIVADLAADERLYTGAAAGLGLGALVSTRVAPLAASVELALSRDPQAVEAAYGALKDLERALKAELPSALGLTLSFQAGDGD
jgi:predicted lipoprotein